VLCGKVEIASQDCDGCRDHSGSAPQQNVSEENHNISP